MNILVPITMFGWIPIVVVMFAAMPPRRATLISLLGAWMFLPMASIKLASGIPPYSKMAAACYGVLLGTILFNANELWRFKPKLLDLVMVVWCLCPLFSSVSNGLGIYDGLSSAFEQTIIWGLPYLIGRLYFGSDQGMRELAIATFIGGLIYIPFCWFEIRFSPQLHRMIYGFSPVAIFAMNVRYGGYRPNVFMQSGLMVGMWMAMATLIGFWLWWSQSVRILFRVPIEWLLGALVITTIFCKATGAIMLLLIGITVLLLEQRLRRHWLMVILMLVPPTYILLRTTGAWSGNNFISAVDDAFGASRGQSVEYRFNAENLLVAKALEQPIFGWGGWGRARIKDSEGEDMVGTDGLWVITFGNYGIVGLAALTLSVLLPSLLLVMSTSPRQWAHPTVAPAAVISVILCLFMIDNLMNGMLNPVYVAMAGGLVAFELPNRRIKPAAMKHLNISRDGFVPRMFVDPRKTN
ncbi:MAG TPA: hypothetical protein VGG19_12920 [Tepidisphaeraceae bacterium]|jgi:hypothetical protein